MKNDMIRCPRCNSPEIYPVLGGYSGYYYRCKKCGYSGALVIEYDDDEAPKEKRDLQQEYREEVQEYDTRRRPLLWAALVLFILIVAAFFLVFR